MIYAITLDRSEVGHVMPVVYELEDMGRPVRVVSSDHDNLPTITCLDTVLCVGDRIQLLRYLVNECPDSKIVQLHAGEETTSFVDDSRYRWAISSLAYKRLLATKEATDTTVGEFVGSPCLEHYKDRVAEAEKNPPLDGKDYVLFAMNAWILSSEKYVNECLERTCRAARERGWWVYTIVPNYEKPYEIKVDEPNQIIQTNYSVPHDEFQRLIAGAHLMVGNSSAGVIEAPSLGTQSISLAPRQRGRPVASSVLDVEVYDNHGHREIERMSELFDEALTLDFSYQPYNRIAHPAKKAAEAVRNVELSARLSDDVMEDKIRHSARKGKA